MVFLHSLDPMGVFHFFKIDGNGGEGGGWKFLLERGRGVRQNAAV